MSDLPGLPPRHPVTLRDGRVMAVAERPGAGPPLLLLHGLTDSADSFRLLAPHLGDRRLILPDLRGHGVTAGGGTGDGGDTAGLDSLAADVADLLDRLDLDGVTLAGHSMGAMIALVCAAHHGARIRRLVLLAGAIRPDRGRLADLAASVAALPDPVGADHPFFDAWHRCETPVSPEFLRLMTQAALVVRRRLWLDLLAAIADCDLRRVAGRLSLPMLAISGAADPIFPAEAMAGLSAGRAERGLRILPGCGHNPHWERPEAVGQAMRDFAAA